jgi:hypothetical protein
MDALRSETARFSALLDLAAASLPQLADTSARIGGHWSRKQILGHLIDSAANNHQRFVRGQLARELVIAGYEQEQWVETERFQDREWNDLVQLWLAYNKHLLHLMTHVPQNHLDASIRIDCEAPQSLEFVMIDYVRHMNHHLEQMGISIRSIDTP